jgi:hypothetical protein
VQLLVVAKVACSVFYYASSFLKIQGFDGPATYVPVNGAGLLFRNLV